MEDTRTCVFVGTGSFILELLQRLFHRGQLWLARVCALALTQQCTVQSAYLWQRKDALPPHWQKYCKSQRIRSVKSATEQKGQSPFIPKGVLTLSVGSRESSEKIIDTPSVFNPVLWMVHSEPIFFRCQMAFNGPGFKFHVLKYQAFTTPS